MIGDMYGVTRKANLDSKFGHAIEEIQIHGYTVLENVFDEATLKSAREKLDAAYLKQEAEFGRDQLAKIDELDTVRSPLAYDDFFFQFAFNEKVLELSRKILGDYVILHLQNGIINVPGQKHHQSSWHRDLPYQDWTISKPIALGALVCVDDFSEKTGGTAVLPFSHRLDHMPSPEYVQKHMKTVEAKAGSVLVFDSMIFHRAGSNTSGNKRRAINNMLTIPLLKQQIDFPAMLGERFAKDPKFATLLGYPSKSPDSVIDYRKGRLARMGTKK